MTGRAVRKIGAAALLLTSVACAAAGSSDAPRSSAAPPSSEGWLEHLNFYRAGAGLPPVSEDPRLSEGDRKHAVYIVKNAALHHDEEPENGWHTPDGRIAAGQSNLALGHDGGDTDRWAIDAWMQSPFHAIGLLDPRLAQVGYGRYAEEEGVRPAAAAMNVIAGRVDAAAAAYPICWPGNGTTIPTGLCPQQDHRQSPSPLASCPGYALPGGLPLILQVGPGDLTPAVTATSFTGDGQALEHCVFDETTYVNPDRDQQRLGRSILGARDAIVLLPRLPLSAGSVYTASITVDGRTHTWSFNVARAAPPQELQVVSGLVR